MNTDTGATVLVSGVFNVLHPGHLRIFNYAKSIGSRLIVAVEGDRIAGSAAHVGENLRLEAIQSCVLVNEAFIFNVSIVELLGDLRPDIVVKGREHEERFNPEANVLKSYGGSLVFSSGEMEFTTFDFFGGEPRNPMPYSIKLPLDFMRRHNIARRRLSDLIGKFKDIQVITIGDLIVDHYIQCEPLGMSQEDVSLVLKPQETKKFVGGAGIVAAHASGLGSRSSLISVIGQDPSGDYCADALRNLSVETILLKDQSRPTTTKQRFRCHDKTILRVSYLQQSAISLELQNELIKIVDREMTSDSLIIFSDFNYGVLPQLVVDTIIASAKKKNILIAADSQSSSQVGDVSRFKGVNLLLPTEREARLATKNREDGLVILAEKLKSLSEAQSIFLKLGSEGVLIHTRPDSKNDWLTDRIAALNKYPRDVAGAGDSMLVASALTIKAGGNVWEAACIGSIASALQVSRLGNIPLVSENLLSIIDQ